MNYLKITLNDSESSRESIFQRGILKILKLFIPMTNPDFDNRIDLVKTWYLEFENETNPPTREVGVDDNGKVIVITPYKNNIGYWVDNNLSLDMFKQRFFANEVSKNEFELLWSKYINSVNSKNK